MNLAGRGSAAWRVPAAALAGVALLLAVAGLPRGIDLTDEAFYWLHFLHWQQFNFHITFFGAYLDLPFRLVGGNALAMRALGLTMLIASVIVFLRAAQRHLQLESSMGWTALMGTALALSHYGFLWTLRTPSYNTLALCCMLLSSALLLAWLRETGSWRKLLALGYGVLLGVCCFSKASAGLALMALHLLILLLEHRAWKASDLATALLAALLGLLLNALYLQIRHPAWLEALRNGLEFARVIETRDMLLALRVVYWSWAKELGFLTPILLGSAVAGFVAWRAVGALRNAALLALVALPVLLLMPLDRERLLWWPASAGAALAIWLLASRSDPRRPGAFSVLALGLLGPWVFSIGTNIPLAVHTQMAALLPLGLIWLGLCRLQAQGGCSLPVIGLCSALLVLPGLAAQAWPWLSPAATYRQASTQAEAGLALPSDSPLAGLRSDAVTVTAIQRFRTEMAAAGFRAGEPLLDFTGANPGLVHLAGGRPLGLAWMLGAYPGSREAAALVLERQPEAELRNAWLLLSPDAARRIPDALQLLQQRLGSSCHQRQARFRLQLPATGDVGQAPASIDLEIWRPVCSRP